MRIPSCGFHWADSHCVNRIVRIPLCGFHHVDPVQIPSCRFHCVVYIVPIPSCGFHRADFYCVDFIVPSCGFYCVGFIVRIHNLWIALCGFHCVDSILWIPLCRCPLCRFHCMVHGFHHADLIVWVPFCRFASYRCLSCGCPSCRFYWVDFIMQILSCGSIVQIVLFAFHCAILSSGLDSIVSILSCGFHLVYSIVGSRWWTASCKLHRAELLIY